MIHIFATNEGSRGKSTELFQAVGQHNVRLNGKLMGEEPRNNYGPATIREAQIAVSEVLGGDYALRALSSISWLLERRASNRSATIFIFFFLEIT